MKQPDHNTQHRTASFINRLISLRFFLFIVLSLSQSVHAVSYSLGEDDGSDAEFLSGSFAQLVDMDELNDASSFPKEINLYNWNVQYIRFKIHDSIDFEELNLLIDASWNNGNGFLQLELSILSDGKWTVVDSGHLSSTQDLELTIPAAQLQLGIQDLRLRAIKGLEETSVVGYDKITLMSKGANQNRRPIVSNKPASREAAENQALTSSKDRIYIALGQANSYDGEFFSGNFDNHADVSLDHSSAEVFPRELNSSWWPRQFFHLNITQSQSQKDLRIDLDAFWNDGSGHLIIDLLVWNGSAWSTVSTTTVSAKKNGRLTVQADHLTVGINHFQLFCSGGTGETNSIVWDQIVIQSE
jgi:hypothetical protein